MTKAEKFINDFMQAFDENGLAAPENVMYLRAYQELEILKQLKAKNLLIVDVVVPKGTFVCSNCGHNKTRDIGYGKQCGNCLEDAIQTNAL